MKMHKIDKAKSIVDEMVVFEGFDLNIAQETLMFDWFTIVIEGVNGRSDTYYWTKDGEVVFLINIFDYKHHSNGNINYMYINYAETNSIFRRQGLGRECMKQFEEYCIKQLGVSCFILCTIDSDESKDFFSSLGYTFRGGGADPNEMIKDMSDYS